MFLHRPGLAKSPFRTRDAADEKVAKRSEGFRSNAERRRRSGGIDAAGKQGEEETLAAKKVKFEEAYSPGHRGSIDEPSDDEAREGKRGIVISEPA